MSKRPANIEIEIGDFVTIIASDDANRVGSSGILDNVFIQDGREMFAVVFSDENFAYATKVVLFKKAS